MKTQVLKYLGIARGKGRAGALRDWRIRGVRFYASKACRVLRLSARSVAAPPSSIATGADGSGVVVVDVQPSGFGFTNSSADNPAPYPEATISPSGPSAPKSQAVIPTRPCLKLCQAVGRV